MDPHAEDEDALRCQAVQVHRNGQAHAPPGREDALNEHKPSTRTRRLDGDKVVAPGDAAKAKKLLGKSA